jgi:hypothetical protein
MVESTLAKSGVAAKSVRLQPVPGEGKLAPCLKGASVGDGDCDEAVPDKITMNRISPNIHALHL